MAKHRYRSPIDLRREKAKLVKSGFGPEWSVMVPLAGGRIHLCLHPTWADGRDCLERILSDGLAESHDPRHKET